MQQKLILFDIDGTIVISRDNFPRDLFVELVEVFFDKKISLEGYRFSGRTDKAIITQVMVIAGISPELHALHEADMMKWIEDQTEARTRPESYHLLKGVPALLEELSKNENISLALLTGNLPRCAEVKLGHFDLMRYFAFGSYGIESIDRNDLGPIALRKHKELTGQAALAENVVIIGDAEPDVLVAKHIGAKSIITLTGRTTREEVAPHFPDYIFDDLSDTEKVLSAIYN